MTGSDRNAEDPVVNPSANTSVAHDRIAAELAALGEDPLDPGEDEFAFVAADGRPRTDADVATLQTLAGWASAPEDPGHADDSLCEIAQARVWRTVELRTRSTSDNGASPPTERTRSTRPVVLGLAVAMLAVAAGVLLVPVLVPDSPADSPSVAEREPTPAATLSSEELDVMSMQARASLDALDRLSGEPRGTKRVEALAADYAQRLNAERGNKG